MIGAFASTANAQIEAKIKIGILFPASGPGKVFGEDFNRGVKAALGELKAKSPQVFQKVTVVGADSGGLVSQTEKEARRLYGQNRVDVILGGLTYLEALAIGKVAAENSKPMISPAAQYWHSKNKYAFFLQPSFFQQGKLLAKFAVQSLGKKNIFILHPNNQYGTYLAKGFYREARKLGAKVPGVASFPTPIDTIPERLAAVRSKKPDLVFMPAFYPDVQQVLRLASVKGLRLPFLGADGWDSPALFNASGVRMAGNYYYTPFSMKNSSPSIRGFAKLYESYFNRTPSPFAALGYEAFTTIMTAFKNTKSVRGKVLREAIAKTVQAEVNTGQAVKFDSFGNRLASGVIHSTTNVGPVFFRNAKW